MGTTFRRGKRWGISYIDPVGRQIRKIVAPYKETAEMILKKIETQIAEGKYLDVRQEKRILFDDFVREYINIHVKFENVKSFSKFRCLINNLKNHFKGKYLHQIDTLVVRQYLSKRLEKVKASTVNRDFTMLKSMFNRAIEWGMFSRTNPVNGIKKLSEKNSRCRWLTEEEQDRLLSYCKGHTRVLVIIALKTGMRWSEIVSLKWHQSPNSNYVDFDRGMIFIHESLAKSEKSRHIPLSNAVRLALREIPRSHGSDYIFLNPETNKPLGSIKLSFKTALRKAEIQDFRFHDLRHTFASQLVRNGVDLYTVQKLLGHSTPAMTQRYTHLHEDHLKEAIEKIDIQPNNLLYNSNFVDSTLLAHSPSGQKAFSPDLAQVHRIEKVATLRL